MISIVIPAHNEEKYITKTLSHIKNLSYPKESFEVIVVENGSTDATYSVAKKFEDNHIRIFHTESRGVSKAKNFGMQQVSDESKWIVFLDADTILQPLFLKDLEVYLYKNRENNFAIGTTSVMPFENNSWYAILWMKLYNIGHKYGKKSFAIQIMNASLREKVQFDKSLSLAEDLQFIEDCMKYGRFFYFDTKDVLTSTRRFEKIGWVKLFIKWNYDALMYSFRKIKPDYPVIR